MFIHINDRKYIVQKDAEIINVVDKLGTATLQYSIIQRRADSLQLALVISLEKRIDQNQELLFKLYRNK